MKNENSAFYLELGKILREARQNKHLSLSQLSDLVVNKSKSTLKRYEDGKARIDMDTLASLCDILSLNLSETVNKASSSSDAAVVPTPTELDTILKIRHLTEPHRSTIAEMINLFFRQDEDSH